jgi:hypothetical protein
LFVCLFGGVSKAGEINTSASDPDSVAKKTNPVQGTQLQTRQATVTARRGAPNHDEKGIDLHGAFDREKSDSTFDHSRRLVFAVCVAFLATGPAFASVVHARLAFVAAATQPSAVARGLSGYMMCGPWKTMDDEHCSATEIVLVSAKFH